MIEIQNQLEIKPETAIAQNRCYQQCFLSDNLDLMKTIESNTIDLIYCDILYGTGRNFSDYQDLKPIRSEIEAHYLPRLKEMYRILKPTGSIYLQMDTRINHWMRILMDDIFGYDRMLNEIVVCISKGNQTNKHFAKRHDILLYYTKTKEWIYNLDAVSKENPEHKRYKYQDEKGMYRWHIESIKDYKMYLKKQNINDVWSDVGIVQGNSIENTGYSTQKPKSLIERIIKASSNEGDLVADFYAGSFTTAVVCKELNRNFIGCDINPLALEISKQRLA
jgi:site-specific DNA-methyltransferase (adenine-specific)